MIYSKYGGTEVKYAGEEYLILSARDVLAVVSLTHHPDSPSRSAACSRATVLRRTSRTIAF